MITTANPRDRPAKQREYRLLPWNEKTARLKAQMAWAAFRSRCHNPNDKWFKSYGGRGISVAPEWRDDSAAFIRDVGLPPSREHSVDRIDNDGNYEPGNCRWATKVEQSMNRRRSWASSPEHIAKMEARRRARAA